MQKLSRNRKNHPSALTPQKLAVQRRRQKQRVSPFGQPGKLANKQTKLLLRRPAGATITALAEASGWQSHPVRGFLAGVVRKKLGLDLVSVVEADQRTYRIVAAKQA